MDAGDIGHMPETLYFMIACICFFMTTNLLKVSYGAEFMKTFNALTSVIPVRTLEVR